MTLGQYLNGYKTLPVSPVIKTPLVDYLFGIVSHESENEIRNVQC